MKEQHELNGEQNITILRGWQTVRAIGWIILCTTIFFTVALPFLYFLLGLDAFILYLLIGMFVLYYFIAIFIIWCAGGRLYIDGDDYVWKGDFRKSKHFTTEDVQRIDFRQGKMRLLDVDKNLLYYCLENSEDAKILRKRLGLWNQKNKSSNRRDAAADYLIGTPDELLLYKRIQLGEKSLILKKDNETYQMICGENALFFRKVSSEREEIDRSLCISKFGLDQNYVSYKMEKVPYEKVEWIAFTNSNSENNIVMKLYMKYEKSMFENIRGSFVQEREYKVVGIKGRKLVSFFPIKVKVDFLP